MVILQTKTYTQGKLKYNFVHNLLLFFKVFRRKLANSWRQQLPPSLLFFGQSWAPLVPFPDGNELLMFTKCAVDFYPIAQLFISTILVPRCRAPFGQYQESRPLAGSDALSMRREFVSYSQPIILVLRSRAPPRIATSGKVHFSEHAQSNRFAFSANQICQTWLWACVEWWKVRVSRTPGAVLDLPRCRNSWCWPKGARPQGTRID